jgi:lipopolysaccharide export system permease protein
MLKKIDWYILKKFFGTFNLAIILIMMIVIVFDVSEKIEDFIDKDAPINAIVGDYYLNFIPYFANQFSPLFCFISVIFFTSRMASKTEIVAILSSGISFKRFLLPFMIGAMIITLGSLYLNHFVIPHANRLRNDFEDAYIRNQYHNNEINIHRQINPGTFIYFNSYNNIKNIGYQFSMEKIHNGNRMYYLRSDYVKWDSVTSRWSINNYFIRYINGNEEVIKKGQQLDTVLNFKPSDFGKRIQAIENLNFSELNSTIETEKEKGATNIEQYEVVKYGRTAFPFATIILTLIAVAIASRKVRGGIGLHLGVGLGLGFSYVMLMQVATQLSLRAGVPAYLGVWMPNVIYLFIAIWLISRAQK